MSIELDDADRTILAAMQVDARIPQSALGSRVGLSAAAVNRRLRRLTDAGVIEHTVAVVAPEAVGASVTVVVQIEVESEQIDLLDRVRETFVACPQVQQCYYVTGEWDFVLVMLVSDMDEYRRITRELFFASNNVKRFKTLVAMERCKATLEVPISGT